MIQMFSIMQAYYMGAGALKQFPCESPLVSNINNSARIPLQFPGMVRRAALILLTQLEDSPHLAFVSAILAPTPGAL